VCGGGGARAWKPSDLAGRAGGLQPSDLAITDDRYGTTLALLACPCGFRFADPREVPDLTALYARLDDPAYEAGSGPRGAQQRALVRAVLAERPRSASLLDVGAASGLLVREAEGAGLAATGDEPSAPLAAAARRAGLDVRTGTLPMALPDDRRFDVVCLVDVVEHVADPVELLAAATARLVPGGVALVVTPDVRSLAARVLGRRWWHLRLAHVGYFDRRTLATALDRAGLRPVRWWRPGWVFEVSYLADRVVRYLPPLRPVAARLRRGRLGRAAIGLNPRDSLAVLAERR
jgi:SAM-dependent methyltransferase